MEVDDLRILLALLVDANGGLLVLKKEQVEAADLKGKTLVIVPGEDELMVTLEREEEIDEYFEDQETGPQGEDSDEGAPN